MDMIKVKLVQGSATLAEPQGGEPQGVLAFVVTQ